MLNIYNYYVILKLIVGEWGIDDTYVGGNMESRNVKVIDEHGIERDANIICKFTIDDNDYVLYSIERDNENDNLFVSKLVNNNDGTSSMVDIDNDVERTKINDVAKQLVTYAINSEKGDVNG